MVASSSDGRYSFYIESVSRDAPCRFCDKETNLRGKLFCVDRVPERFPIRLDCHDGYVASVVSGHPLIVLIGKPFAGSITAFNNFSMTVSMTQYQMKHFSNYWPDARMSNDE